MDWNALRAPIPRDRVKWRAQTVTKDGAKAMALAYIDARVLMDRLDEVCGPENWQDSYEETAKGRVLCTLSLRVGGEWVAKSDGAGDSDMEGEKGGISDAFKRAGVKWGISRELYALPAPWVPCECGQNGKWRKWTADPWDFVRQPRSAPQTASPPKRGADSQKPAKAAQEPAKAHDEPAPIDVEGAREFYRLVKAAEDRRAAMTTHEDIATRVRVHQPDAWAAILKLMEETAA